MICPFLNAPKFEKHKRCFYDGECEDIDQDEL